MPTLDNTDQTLLTKAFKDALTGATGGSEGKTLFGLLDEVKTAIAGIPAGGGGSGVPPMLQDPPPGGGQQQEDLKNAGSALTELNEAGKKAADGSKGMMDAIFTPIAEIITKVDAGIEAITKFDAKVTEYTSFATNMYDPIQEALGGINAAGKSANETTAAVMRNFEQSQQIYLASADDLSKVSSGLVANLQDGSGQQVNVLRRVFKNVEEVYQAAEDMQNAFHDNYQLRFNEMDETQKAQLITFEKGLGISGQKVAELVQRQIQRTGQASNETLMKISAFSKSVSDATGLAFKQVAEGITEIILNVETFGNVQEEEAARIVGTLQQLGTSYRSFGQMVNKFMSFDTAAAEIGKLTSVFGVHMDAMEMMQLANEDEEEFLHRIRDAFIDQGIAVEDLTKAQRNMLASTLGIQAAEVENFFDPDLLEVDLDALTDATEEADVGQAFDVMITNAKQARQAADDLDKDMRAMTFAPFRTQAFQTANAMQTLKTEGFDEVAAGIGEVQGVVATAMGGLQGMINMGTDKTLGVAKLNAAGFEEIANEVESGSLSVMEGIVKAGQKDSGKLATMFANAGVEGAAKFKENLIKLDVDALTSPVGKSLKSQVELTVDDFIAPDLISEVSTQLSGITSDPQITATVNTVVNDATMNKLDQIEQQQIFIKKERDNVLTKITEGIGRLADKIVAKIEERQVINLDVTATVDEGVLFNTMTTKEVNGRQIPTVLSEEIGVQ
jgi:hypothetical protein